MVILASGLLLAPQARAASDPAVTAVNDSRFTPLTDMGEGFKTMIDRESQIELGLGIVTIFASRGLDTPVQQDFAGHERWGHLEPLGNNVLGTGVPGTILGLGIWAFGLGFNDDRETHVGAATTEVLLATFVFTSLLKNVIRRERPDGSDYASFPSGHTSTMAASSTVLAEFYGWKVGIPAFALTLITAEGRWSTDRHYFSDTVGGAVLGAFVGQAFSRPHLHHLEVEEDAAKKKNLADWRQWSVSPFFQEDGGGVMAHIEF